LKLDYAKGVKYILEKSACGFEPERDLPYMSLLCVTQESQDPTVFCCILVADNEKAALSSFTRLVCVTTNKFCDFYSWM
jgi:hypothetical protein